jgi:integrase
VLALKTSLFDAQLAPATVKKQLGLLRQGLEAAVVAGLIARNPASAVRSPSLAGTHERRALSGAEVEQLLAAAAVTPYDVAIRFALSTGCRQAELLGARWQDIDLERSAFLVQQTLAYVGHEFRMLPPKTKNSRRTIELSAATVALLKAHRARQNAERLRLGSIWRDFDLVFPGQDGGPQYRQAFYRGFRVVVTSAGLERPEMVNWHTLRHTAASLWIAAGVDVFTVSRRLGHGSASFSMDQYGHLLKGQQRAAAEALDHLLAMR